MSAATVDDQQVLDDRLRQLARMPQLLVACDFDGTLAPIVDDPMQAAPRRESVVAMRALAALPQTHVAVVSGRALRDLAMLSRLPEEIRLVGSHGSEFEFGWADELPAAAQALRTQITHDVTQIALQTPGAHVEQKPTGVAFHFRQSPPDSASLAIEQIMAGPVQLDGVHAKHGKAVLELTVVDTSKGSAIEILRQQVGASAVLFVGDDVTDEDGFARLSGPDVGIKVGDGRTQAEFRVSDTEGVARVLAGLSDQRSQWLMGSAAVPIEHHSVLSDQRTAAVVAPDAAITWMCAPRIDSGAVFAQLVGGPAAGSFSVRPLGGGRPTEQHYVDRTMVLRSVWPKLTVTDFLDCSDGRPSLRAGRSDLIRVLEGTARVEVEFAPRLDFGRTPTRLEVRADGLEVQGSADLMVLRAPGVRWEIRDDGIHQTARAVIELDDEPVPLELRCGTTSVDAEPASERSRRQATEDHWREWVDDLDVPSIESELVRRSALAIRSMVHGPTGAIVVAATTSLPQYVGGTRNWDDRYCWLRQASRAMTALVRLGSSDEAMALLDWLLRILDEREHPHRLPPLFNVTGRHLPPEGEISELPGYAGSRPARVGNAAERQIQNDVFGPLIALVRELMVGGAPLSAAHWQLVEAVVAAVEQRWSEPDHGIWEIRRAPRHHTHSKVMCWSAVQGAMEIAGELRGSVPAGWADLRDAIAGDVVGNAWRPDLRAFVGAYDGSDLDASVLSIGLAGLIDGDDPRFVSTVEAVETALRDGPTVSPYRADDGLPGSVGGSHLMTSWLIDAYLLVGRRDDAVNLFADLVDLVGPTGLLSGQFDAANDRALGNVPHTDAHVGLITNALHLEGRR